MTKKKLKNDPKNGSFRYLHKRQKFGSDTRYLVDRHRRRRGKKKKHRKRNLKLEKQFDFFLCFQSNFSAKSLNFLFIWNRPKKKKLTCNSYPPNHRVPYRTLATSLFRDQSFRSQIYYASFRRRRVQRVHRQNACNARATKLC